MVKAPKKLIEVALPLDDINAGAAYEKLPGIGPHPRGIHHWWARRPFAAARALLFAQMVNDPGGERGWGNYKGQTIEQAEKEREYLFSIIRRLADWKNSDDESLLHEAYKQICKSFDEIKHYSGNTELEFPIFCDPFSGGGAIPFEAQRLGIQTVASDLNPVSVITLKAMMEIPRSLQKLQSNIFSNSALVPNSIIDGLSDKVIKYGNELNKRSKAILDKAYPKYKITKEIVSENKHLSDYLGQELTVVAYIWARTVKSPSPAFSHVNSPLVSSFVLSTKKNNQHWVEPIVEADKYKFIIKTGTPPKEAKNGTKLARGANFKCLVSGVSISPDYIKSEGVQKRIGHSLIAVVLQGRREKVYAPPIDLIETYNLDNIDLHYPKTKLSTHPQYIGVRPYGYEHFGDLFTKRQLASLTTYINGLEKISRQCEEDYLKKNNSIDDAKLYSRSIVTYLSLVISRCANFNNTLNLWAPGNEKIMFLFNRQAIPMAWDFGEANIVEDVVGGFESALQYVAKCIRKLSVNSDVSIHQGDARRDVDFSGKIIQTDPPYYDNVPYSDISDFFYVWLRESLRSVYPDLFSTLTTPKSDELVADVKRHKGALAADEFFMSGMKDVFNKIHNESHNYYPVAIYYAFRGGAKQDDANKGWASFLNAIIESGFSITGTWPLRTESTVALKTKKNFLASSILIVCVKRDKRNTVLSKREFARKLKEELPEALEAMIGGKKGVSPIAPVDLAQAAIGPGMAVFSRYPGIIEADGSKMSVQDALIQINQVIDEFFNEAEGDMDSDTRFCIDWFMQYGFKQAEFGQANTLAQAKGTTVDGLAVAGVVETGGGKVRLLKFEEYPENWDPEKDTRTPTWEALHQLIRALRSGGEAEAGLLLKKMAERTESIRQLAYRLYTLCERKGWAEEARAYNELIASWHGTIEAAEQAHAKSRAAKQLTLDM